jgi:hypothetical protein
MGASQKQAVAGDTPNLAARLQARRWNPVSAKKPVFRGGGAASASGAVIKKFSKTVDSALICDTCH